MPAEKSGHFGYWRDPVFLCSFALYALNREVIKPGLHVYSPFFHGHLNDSLLVPVALPVFLFVYRRLGLRPDDAPPRWWEIVLHVMVWSLFYKWFGPVVLHHGVADPLDVACFAGGGAVAWVLWQVAGKLPARGESTREKANQDDRVVISSRLPPPAVLSDN